MAAVIITVLVLAPLGLLVIDLLRPRSGPGSVVAGRRKWRIRSVMSTEPAPAVQSATVVQQSTAVAEPVPVVRTPIVSTTREEALGDSLLGSSVARREDVA